MATFKVGDLVHLAHAPNITRGTVVEVSHDGHFVTVRWTEWPGPQGTTAALPAESLRKLPA